MKITREDRTRPLVTLTSGTSGSGGSGGQVPPGQVIVSNGSNGGTSWSSNVAIITANGSNQLTGPFVNFQSGTGISFATSSNTLTISATGSGGGSGTTNPAWVINANAAPYNCVGDDSTDNKAGIQAAVDAAYTAAAAANGVGVVEFDAGIYRISGALVSSGNFYAQVMLPERAGTASKVMLIIRPKIRTDVGYPGGLQSSTQLSNVIFKSTLTGQTYSGTHGTPSMFGGPDPEKTANFSNIGIHFQGVSFRAPADPSICALNLQLVNQAIVEDAYFDTSDTIAGGITEPTNVTGLSVLMPQEGNNAIAEYRGNVWAIGWYAGPGITEHTVANHVTAYRCYVGINIQNNYYHAAQISIATVEHCPYVIATVYPSAGITNPAGVNNYATFNIDLLDIEDAASGWAAPVQHVNDPGNDYHGRVRYIRTLAAVGTQEGALTVSGGANLSLDDLTDPSSSVIDYGEDADISDLDFDDVADAGVLDEVARADHVHGMPAEPSGSGSSGAILLESGHAVPFTFDEILQESDGSDFLHASA
jgi:hypothetical protein